MVDKLVNSIDFVDDGSEEILVGFWPVLKRVIIVMLPLWIILIGYSAGLNIFLTAILAGSSISSVVIFEKIKVRNR